MTILSDWIQGQDIWYPSFKVNFTQFEESLHPIRRIRRLHCTRLKLLIIWTSLMHCSYLGFIRGQELTNLGLIFRCEHNSTKNCNFKVCKWRFLTLFAPAYLSISEAPLNILGLGEVGVWILFWNDLFWNDLPFSKGFVGKTK